MSKQSATRTTWVSTKAGDDGPETIEPGHEWQMPQGGIDPGEDPGTAARRELLKETGISSVVMLGSIPEWLTYEFPPYGGPPHRLAAFRGQRQRWFAMRFAGEDAEIDVVWTVEEVPPEFCDWRWERLSEIPSLVVPFKRAIYVRLASEFAPFAA